MRSQPFYRLSIGATIRHNALNRAVAEIAQAPRGWALIADQIDTTVAPTTRTILLAHGARQESVVFWVWGAWARGRSTGVMGAHCVTPHTTAERG